MFKFVAEWLSTISAALCVAALIGEGNLLLTWLFATITMALAIGFYKKGE